LKNSAQKFWPTQPLVGKTSEVCFWTFLATLNLNLQSEWQFFLVDLEITNLLCLFVRDCTYIGVEPNLLMRLLLAGTLIQLT